MTDNSFKRIKEYYDEEYYAGDALQRSGLPWHCRVIASRVPDMAGKRVLDVGCGRGEWLEMFRARGAIVSGIDLSQKAIERCRQHMPDAEFHCGPAETLPFGDAQFDLVLCMGSLEHFVDKPRALREMLRVSRPGAAFLILVPNAGFLTRRLGWYQGTNQAKVAEEVLSLSQWSELFAQAGLIVSSRWRDLHPLSWAWIRLTPGVPARAVRALQATALALWPVGWQYQVYHYCRRV